LESLDIAVSMPFEVRREIQKRLRQYSFMHEVEDDEEATEPTVAVQEWMDRLELVVDEGATYEDRQGRSFVEESLEIGKHLCEQVRWRWHEDGIGGTPPANPIWGSTELARGSLLTAHAAKQLTVHVSEEPIAQREIPHLLESTLQGADVVRNLAPVPRLGKMLSLRREDIAEA
jgi:hypothetical protein